MAGLQAIYESVEATGQLDRFDFFILSDTTKEPIRQAEIRAFQALRERTGLGQAAFILLFGVAKRRDKRRLRSHGAQGLQLRQVPPPALADALVEQGGKGGLAWASQRRGVTPLVLLLKRVGKIRAKSARIDCVISSECRADTPLIEWLTSTAR